jgi:hypothetical protein
VKRLELDRCNHLTDLSMLIESDQMESLQLKFCSELTSLKGLEKIPKLFIFNCPKIVDWNGLENKRNVTIKKLGK